MKRQIICVDCVQTHPMLFATNHDRYPGEHILNVPGTAHIDCLCDFCGSSIMAGSQCYANSIWSDHSPNPYTAWESDYIQPLKEGETENAEK